MARENGVLGKREASSSEDQANALKSGQRPQGQDVDQEEVDFEDEYEDEFESEDEIMEAGVDGRPDAEREAEEKAGTYT